MPHNYSKRKHSIITNGLLFVALFPGSCLALSWFKNEHSAVGTLDKETNRDFADNEVLDSFSEQDAAALRLNLDVLQAYTHKPDCFKVAAGRIQGSCSESDMDQDSRVTSAISMTLCEVMTATHHSIPLECRLFTTKSGLSSPPSPRARGDCVDALSRSAQLWSSFSGYMREIPQLCHAFRRWNDIDLARNLYYNATVEKIALLRFIFAREKSTSQNVEDARQRLSEMQDITAEIRSYHERQQVYEASMAVHMKNAFDDFLDRLWEASRQVASVREASDVAAAARVEAKLFDALQLHASGLNEALNQMVPSVASRLNDVLSHHNSEVGRLDLLINNAASKWLDVELSFGQMESAFLQLSSTSEMVSNSLDSAVQNIQSIKASQEEAEAAASALAYTLANMTNATSIELLKINLTLHDIGQQFQAQLQHDVHPWKDIVMKTLELVYRVDPGSLAHIEQLFSFRLLMACLGFGWTAMRAALSVVAALATLVFLATRRCVFGPAGKSVEGLLADIALAGMPTSASNGPLPSRKWHHDSDAFGSDVENVTAPPNMELLPAYAATRSSARNVLRLATFDDAVFSAAGTHDVFPAAGTHEVFPAAGTDRRINAAKPRRVSRIPDRLCFNPA